MSRLSDSEPIVRPRSTAVALPADAEHEWRFSYQFAARTSSSAMRFAFVAGLVALTLVAVKVAW